jgi:carbon monoxide dehydrogenase subunit G
VGPIKSSFSGIVILTEIHAPNRIAGTVEGDDKSSASSVKASFTGTLKTAADGTEAAFVVEANLRGRLAQFGGPVITATAKKITAEFAKNLREKLE